MSYSDSDMLLDRAVSTCCEAPVLIGAICTKCHEHCGTAPSAEEAQA